MFDAVRGIGDGDARGSIFPGHAYVGETRDCTVTVVGRQRVRGTRWVALPDARRWSRSRTMGARACRWNAGRGAVLLPLEMLRRGTARFEQLWLRWTGPLGLAWQPGNDRDRGGVPDPARPSPGARQGARIFQRHALEGLIAQLDRGDGSDFDALVEFRSGMDRRAIDWKQSARH